MTHERVFFSHTVAAMFVEAFPPAAFPGLGERLKDAGLDVSGPLLPAYPYAVWRAALEAQRAIVFPGRALDEASREQGARYVEAYFERTIIGGPLRALLRLLGPRRSLDRMTRNFKTANNFSEVRFEQTGEGEGLLTVNDVFSASPHYMVGIVEHGLRLCGMRTQLTPLQADGQGWRFTCRW